MSEHEPPNQPYGQPTPPANPYGQPQQPYGAPGGWAPPPEHPQATMILVLGILSLVLCQICGPFAWVMGNKARSEIKASGGTIGGETQVTIGWICGIIATCLLAVSLILIVIYFVFIIVLFGSMAAV